MNNAAFTPEGLLQEALNATLAGHPAQGEVLVRPLLGHDLLSGQAMFVLGVAKAAQSQHRLAEAWFEQCTALQPDYSDAWANLASARDNQGLANEASEAWLRCALTYYHKRDLDQALQLLKRILVRDPGFLDAYINIAAVLDELHQPAESMRYAVMLLRALQTTVAGLPAILDMLPESLRSLEAAPLKSEHPELALRIAQTLNNLGNSAIRLPDFELAEQAYQLAHELAPAQALVSWNLSMLRLGRGDFSAGWQLYEARWDRPDWEFPRRDLPKPLWRGEAIVGRTLLVYCEQGLGDSMQFMSLLQRVVDKGVRVIFEVQPGLLWLTRHSLESAGLMVIPRMEDPRQVYGDPAYDYHVSVMSLPHVLNLQLSELPVATGYLCAEPAGVERWRERLPATTRKRVGIVWAGSPSHKNNASRSIAFERLQSLWNIETVEWHSLQVGEGPEAALQQACLPQLRNWAGQLTPFAETAGLLEHLDLVISVDTSVAHLAGAMGKPTWVLLSHPSEWRWLRDRDDCPWYPSARLFRQATPGDWDAVIERVGQALRDLA